MTRLTPTRLAAPAIAPRNNGSTDATTSLKAIGVAAVPGAIGGRGAKRRHVEDDIQASLVDHLTWRLARGVVWYAVPNGEKRDKITARRLKRLGVRAGVADLAFVLPGGSAAYLELKAGRDGRQSTEQKQFEADVIAAGARYALARTIDDALAVLKGWGAIR